jgi:hypothetical protein
MAGPLDQLNDPKQDPNLLRMGADIPAQMQGQLLLEALSRALPPGGGNPREQAEAKAREQRVKGQPGAGAKHLDVGQLLQMLLAGPSTQRPVSTNESPSDIAAAFRNANRPPGYDELQAEEGVPYRKP